MEGNGNKTIEDMAETKAYEGPIIDIGNWIRRDGDITKIAEAQAQQKLGVIQRAITSVNEDDDYRQILLLVKWKDIHEQDLYCAALDCCRRTGAKKTFKAICDRLTARRGGVDGWLLNQAFDALTHTTFTSNKFDGKGKYGNRGVNSPLSK